MGGRISLLHGRGCTRSAVVVSYSELVEAPGVADGELVVIGVRRVLTIPHVYSQLVAPLGRDLVYVVQAWRDKQ